MARQLEADESGRNDSYDRVLKHYGGSSYRDRKKRGYWLRDFVSIFRKRAADEDIDSSAPINLIRPAILSKVAYMGLPPTTRVPEPMMDDEDAAIEFADKQEKAYLGLQRASNFPRRCYDMAWFQGAMGGAALGIWPDMRHKRPKIFVRGPQHFYVIPYDDDGLEIAKCLWVDEMRGLDIAAKWGAKKYEGDANTYDVIQYIDEEQLTVIVDDKEEVDSIQNVLGFVPVVCIGNIGVPGTPFGDTDVEPGIELAEEINYRVALGDEQAAAMINPTIAVKQPLEVPDDLVLGQGGRITMGPQGDVQLLGPLPIPESYWHSLQNLERWFDAVTDNPAALRGEQMGNVISGKGFNAMLSPLTARLQIRGNIIYPAIEQMNRYMMKMWWKFPDFQAPQKLAGFRGKEFFQIEVEPEEFVIDKDIYTENEVFLTSQSYLDRQGTDVELMQLYQNELISWDTVVENLPYVANKPRERRRIEKDRQWKAEGMAMANQVANSAMTANPDLGAQERTSYGLERGFMGEMPTPPMPEGEMPTGAPATGAPAEAPPEEGPELIDAIVAIFEDVPKLKGRVWVGGTPLIDPEAMGGEDWVVTVWLEDPADKATIVNYVKQKAPEL